MSTNSESTHAKNVANFKTLISFCIAYGVKYNPTKAALLIAALQTLLADAQLSLKALNQAITPFTKAVSKRRVAFNPLNALVTQVKNALSASEVDESVVDDADSIIRKIQGLRASPKDEGEEAPETGEENADLEEDSEGKSISASQMSFDSRLVNLHKLIELLKLQPEYVPNETELQIATLESVYDNLNALNDVVIDAATTLSNARISRNELLYGQKTGIVAIAAAVKKYVKSVYTPVSPQFKQISGIRFTPNKK